MGMQLFGYLQKTNINDEIIEAPFDPEDTKEIFAPRPNFDGFFNGFISIFIIFIGEDWQQSMYEHYRGQGILSICFFPIVYISLCMIMFNLFLAILIESFITVSDKKEADSDKTALLKIRKFRRQIVNWFERRWKRIKPSRNSFIDI